MPAVFSHFDLRNISVEHKTVKFDAPKVNFHVQRMKVDAQKAKFDVLMFKFDLPMMNVDAQKMSIDVLMVKFDLPVMEFDVLNMNVDVRKMKFDAFKFSLQNQKIITSHLNNTMVSPADENDVASLNILVNSAYRGDSSKQGWTTEADLLGGIRTDEEAIRTLIEQQNSYILKYEEQGNILGCVHLKKEGNKMYLGMLTVNPVLQNKGIGKILMAASEDEARKQNCNTVFMSVISIRTELINWYKKHGYYNTGGKKPFPENDPRFGIPKQHLEFIILEKDI